MAPQTSTPPGGKVYEPQLRQIAKIPVLKPKLPDFLFELWKGYQNKIDPTVMTSILKYNVLTYPSVNCSINSEDKIVPDKGKTLLGAPYTENVGINGQRTKYTNMNGDQMEVRNWRSIVNPDLGDVIEVYWINTQTGIPAWYSITEDINPLPLGVANQRFSYTEWFDTTLNGVSFNVPRLIWVNGISQIFSWTGGITPIGIVTPTTIQTASGVTWASLGFPNLDPVTSTGGTNIIVNGILYTITGGWDTNTLTVSSTAGIASGDVAISQITATPSSIDFTLNYTVIGTVNFVPNEVVSGVTSGATGTVAYVMTGTSPTLTIIPINGIQFLAGETIQGNISGAQGTVTNVNVGTITLDFCDTMQNYPMYGNWNSRQFYIANNFNRVAQQSITSSNAVQNDLSVSQTSGYTGVGSHTYTITIDGVTPGINQQSFYSVTGGTNSSYFDTSGYDAFGDNTYILSVISDSVYTPNTGAKTYADGEYIVGQTSDAVLKIVYGANNSGGAIGTQYINGIPQIGETFLGLQSRETSTLAAFSFITSAQLFKNGIQVLGLPIMTDFPPVLGIIQDLSAANSPFVLIDGLKFDVSSVGTNNVGDYWTLQIQTQIPDTFQVQVDGNPAVAGETGIPISPQTGTLTYTGLTGTFAVNEKILGQTSHATAIVNSSSGSTLGLFYVLGIFQVGETITGLTSGATATVATYVPTTTYQQLYITNPNGVQITFGSAIGHTIGDTWTITVYQAINNAYANFYYTLPIRLPGEGYIATLPSNFWTMGNQENVEYINMANGQWWYFQTTLAKDLLTETLSFQPLKNAVANKCIDPWMIGYMENDLVFVSTDKTLNLIGRMQFLELPQIGTLSKPVQNDFDNASFVGGTITYLNKILNITSPAESIQFQYDNNMGNKYWNPPKTFTENGMQSIVEVNGVDTLMTHSNYRNQSFTMFTNQNGDNGSEYTVTIRTPYEIFKNRWIQKQSNMSFTEGYIQGNPPLKHTVYCDVDGCNGIFVHPIQPVVCAAPDHAPLGEGPNGSHPLGSDVGTVGGYWQEIWPNYKDALNWRFLAIQLDCTTTSHTYSILSMGMNSIDANYNNNPITVVESVLPQ